jgi:hypothetical protein
MVSTKVFFSRQLNSNIQGKIFFFRTVKFGFQSEKLIRGAIFLIDFHYYPTKK